MDHRIYKAGTPHAEPQRAAVAQDKEEGGPQMHYLACYPHGGQRCSAEESGGGEGSAVYVIGRSCEYVMQANT